MFQDFRGTKTATNLAKDLGVPMAAIRKFLTPVCSRRNPYNGTSVDYYSVEQAATFFATPEGQKAAMDCKKEKPASKVLENCDVRWTDIPPGMQPIIQSATGATVKITGQVASIALPDGRKFRKAITSIGFYCSNGQETIDASA